MIDKVLACTHIITMSVWPTRHSPWWNTGHRDNYGSMCEKVTVLSDPIKGFKLQWRKKEQQYWFLFCKL